MNSVLFVCLGNICRSPMAEAVFRHIVEKEGLSDSVRIDSCGTGGWHAGENAHHGTLDVLRRNKISTHGLVARKLAVKDFSDFELIIPMDKSNDTDIRSVVSKHKITNCPPIELLLRYAEDQSILEAPDPYYTGEFDLVFDLVMDGCQGLLRSLAKDCIAI